jgi:hypothetical protein
MLESGPSGSVRGVPSNGHPYRDPRPIADAESTCYAVIMIFVSNGGAVLSLRRQCNEAISNKGSLIVTRP